MNCRKDFLDLTPDERDWLADALNELYDRGRITAIADTHSTDPGAGWFNIHRGPAFLPWHRWLLLTLENELRSIDARVRLLYWDWTKPNAQDIDAEPWKSFFGGRNNTDGRFDHSTRR